MEMERKSHTYYTKCATTDWVFFSFGLVWFCLAVFRRYVCIVHATIQMNVKLWKMFSFFYNILFFILCLVSLQSSDFYIRTSWLNVSLVFFSHFVCMFAFILNDSYHSSMWMIFLVTKKNWRREHEEKVIASIVYDDAMGIEICSPSSSRSIEIGR